MIIDTDDEQIAMLAQGEQPTIVKFWSPACGACRMVAPAFKELAEQCADKIWFLNAQAENLPQAVRGLKVDKLPTLILFQGGREKDRLIGAPNYQKLIDFVQQAL